jgi:hypothetical protein
MSSLGRKFEIITSFVCVREVHFGRICFILEEVIIFFVSMLRKCFPRFLNLSMCFICQICSVVIIQNYRCVLWILGMLIAMSSSRRNFEVITSFC